MNIRDLGALSYEPTFRFAFDERPHRFEQAVIRVGAIEPALKRAVCEASDPRVVAKPLPAFRLPHLIVADPLHMSHRVKQAEERRVIAVPETPADPLLLNEPTVVLDRDLNSRLIV